MQQLHSTIKEQLKSLSEREREVIARVAAGKLNKQIAAELALSEVTVKVHRANAMRKMHATTLAHLIKMLEHVEPSDMTSRWPNLVTAGMAAQSITSPPLTALHLAQVEQCDSPD